jgi:hypothetical protein
MSNTLKSFTVLDCIIILLCVGGAFLFFPLMESHAPAVVAIYRDNQRIARYPLSSPKEIAVQGKEGNVIISIRDESVRVVRADCPRQVCVHAGAIKHSGQQIVCAPNHILIELETSSGKDLDAITQ